jgi:hypothetical protein
MNFRDSNQDSPEPKYISKKVMINGQFVTLYSINGQTWLSSPEDIPALMERLDNARVTLNSAEKLAEAEGPKVATPEAKEKKEPVELPERALSTKYRVKGPKPRPILRQDGVVIKGTPVEPISASNTVMSFSSDVNNDSDEQHRGKAVKSDKSKASKLIAPVAAKKSVKAAVQAALATGKVPAKSTTKTPAKTASRVAPAKDKLEAKDKKPATKVHVSGKSGAQKGVVAKRAAVKASAKKATSKDVKVKAKGRAKASNGSSKTGAKAKKSKR